MNNTVNYAAFNLVTYELYLCSNKTLLAKYIDTSVDTIRRRQALMSSFIVGNWVVKCDVDIVKLSKRSNNFRA